jgi:HEAT repeat protein
MKTILSFAALGLLIGAAVLLPGHVHSRAQEGVPVGPRPTRPGVAAPQSTAPAAAAANATATTGAMVDIPRSALARQIHFRDWTIRETASDSLWRIGRPAVPALVQLLGDPDPYTRVLAIDALAHIGPAAADAVPALIALLDDPVDEVRQYAARALGQIGPAAYSAVPALIDKMQGPRN